MSQSQKKTFTLFPGNKFPEFVGFDILWEGQWQDGALRLLRHPQDAIHLFYLFIAEDLQFKGHICLTDLDKNLTTTSPMNELAEKVLNELSVLHMEYQIEIKNECLKNGLYIH